MMMLSAGMYFFNHATIVETFEALGYPTYIIYPLAILKLLAVFTILYKKFTTLLEWAYAGLFFNFTLAFFAHVSINDGEHFGALIAIILLFTSYFTGKKLIYK